MRTRQFAVNLASVAAALAMISPAWTAEGAACTFKWDVSREVALFATDPRSVAAAVSPDTAPAIVAGRLYLVELKPQEGVHYAIPSSKKMLADGAFGGTLRLKVPKAGHYRVSIDSGFWLDIAFQGKALPAVDFNGSQTCNGPRKIVVYDLPADADLLLQMGNATAATVKLAVTAIGVAN